MSKCPANTGPKFGLAQIDFAIRKANNPSYSFGFSGQRVNRNMLSGFEEFWA